MSDKLQIFAVVVSSAMLLGVLELVRRRRLSERYALLWLAASLILLVLSAWANLLDKVSDLFGVATPVNTLFAVAFGFVILLLLHFSATLSRLSEENKLLAQEAARLDQELRKAQREPSTAQTMRQ